MAFPTNPTNGQQSTQNGVVYTYSSTLTAWTVTTNFVGNITVDQIQANSISSLASIGATTHTGTTVSVTGTVTGGNLVTAGTASVTGTITGGNVTTGGNVSAGGNITGGNITTSGTASVGGNITGSNIATAGNATISTSLAVGSTSPSGTAGEIRATNSITAYYSDRRLKTEIGRIESALDKIDQLTGVLYTQNELAEQFGYNNYERQVGLYAQDVQGVQPEAVKPAPFDLDETNNSKSGENYLTVQYEKLVPLLVEGIKELRVEIKKLKGEE
jgi:hypothetical protein